MSSNPVSGLSPPGSSSYKSGTMSVGDGTWDSDRNDFLLPNLQGLNFATTRYNGMGNRFRDEANYHTLILGHGVLAAITFLGIVPLAVFLARYGHSWPGPRVSFKLHVYCQILVVFLSTVILVLGWFAVGPERSLTNPHHGIGVAIYTLILFQFLYGSCMYRRERRRSVFPTKLPFGVWIHKLLGRSIALLAIVQIALGLTLYGSPKSLFVLYALAGAFLLFWYLALDYYYKPRIGGDAGAGQVPPPQSDYYSDYGSYSGMTNLTGGPPPQRRRRDEHHWGRDLLAAGGVVGAYEVWKHRRDRKRQEREAGRRTDHNDGRPPTGGPGTPGPQGQYPPTTSGGYGPPPIGPASGGGGMGGPPPPGGPHGPHMGRGSSQGRLSGDSWDEKYDSRSRNTWGTRLLEGAGAFAAYEGVKSLFNRRNQRRDEDSLAEEQYAGGPGGPGGPGRYRPQLGGNQSMVSQTDVSRVQAGHAPMSPDTPRVNNNFGGAGGPMTPSMTPSRPPRRGPQSQNDAMSYDSRMDYDGASPPPPHRNNQRPPDDDRDEDEGPHTLRDSIAAFGLLAGAREWNRRRRERKEDRRVDDFRRQEMRMDGNGNGNHNDHDNDEDVFQRRHENTYPRPQDASGINQADDSTLMTGPTANTNTGGGGGGGLDTMNPPLPANAGAFAASGGGGSRSNLVPEQGYSIPPPPPGPPPGGASRQDGYQRPEYHSAYMPPGAVNPDPNRLVNTTDPRFTSANTAANEGSAYGRDHRGRGGLETAGAAAAAGAAGAGLAGAALMSGARRPESDVQGQQSPSRYASRQDSRARLNARTPGGGPPPGQGQQGQQQLPGGSMAQSSASQLPPASNGTGLSPTATPAAAAAAGPPTGPDSNTATTTTSTGEPRISLKVKPHNDGNHVTLRRLREEEAAAERAQRRQNRRNSRQGSQGQPSQGAQRPQQQQQQRRRSSLSSAGGGGGGNDADLSQRYRRPGGPGPGPGPNANARPSSNQPITNIPPPPPMSSSALAGSGAGAGTGAGGSYQPGRPGGPSGTVGSQQSLPYPTTHYNTSSPPYPPYPPGQQQQQQQQTFSSPAPQQQQPGGTTTAGGGFVQGSGVGSPGAYGTDTDVSTFADNRRRRRAERARRLEAARVGNGGGGGAAGGTGATGPAGAGGGGAGEGRVEFQ